MQNDLYIFYKNCSNLIIKSSKYILVFFIILIWIYSDNMNILQNMFKSHFSSNKINIQNNRVCVCTVGKKENKYIKEFIEHYKSLGVDKIFLYDNNDKNGEKFDTILSEYIKDDFVEIFNYRGQTAVQLKIYSDCYNNYKHEYDWFIFFDTDEFLHLSNCVRHTDNDLLYYDTRTLKERFPRILWNSTMYTLKTIMRGKNKKFIRFRTSHWLNRGLKG